MEIKGVYELLDEKPLLIEIILLIQKYQRKSERKKNSHNIFKNIKIIDGNIMYSQESDDLIHVEGNNTFQVDLRGYKRPYEFRLIHNIISHSINFNRLIDDVTIFYMVETNVIYPLLLNVLDIKNK